jgi:hypothetical protein
MKPLAVIQILDLLLAEHWLELLVGVFLAVCKNLVECSEVREEHVGLLKPEAD